MSYSFRDNRIADESTDERTLMCRASGCPHRWSVNFEVPLCSAHSRCTSPQEWPRVTQALLDAEADRAMNPPQKPAERYATKEEGLAALEKLRQMGRGDPRRWAKVLKRREERGRPLSAFQRAAWREALGEVGC